jgi:4-oxalocrotonate tautomerase
VPLLHIHLLEGRDERVLHELAAAVSQETARVLNVPLERVRVLIDEVPRTHWCIGGRPMSELRPTTGDR